MFDILVDEIMFSCIYVSTYLFYVLCSTFNLMQVFIIQEALNGRDTNKEFQDDTF